jgi:hypothetical protein
MSRARSEKTSSIATAGTTASLAVRVVTTLCLPNRPCGVRTADITLSVVCAVMKHPAATANSELHP